MLIQGCSYSKTQDGEQADKANPADEYCVSIGGKVYTEKTDSGWYSTCMLPDGTQHGSWDLFRAANKGK